MKFPQYLWRIGNRHGWVYLRRGHDGNEPIEKFYAKDLCWQASLNGWAKERPVGVMSYCGIDDAKSYGENHAWDWRNE